MTQPNRTKNQIGRGGLGGQKPNRPVAPEGIAQVAPAMAPPSPSAGSEEFGDLLEELEALYIEAMPPGFNDQLYGALTPALVDAFPKLLTLWKCAERVAWQTSENKPGSHDWHLINDLRLAVAAMDEK